MQAATPDKPAKAEPVPATPGVATADSAATPRPAAAEPPQAHETPSPPASASGDEAATASPSFQPSRPMAPVNFRKFNAVPSRDHVLAISVSRRAPKPGAVLPLKLPSVVLDAAPEIEVGDGNAPSHRLVRPHAAVYHYTHLPAAPKAFARALLAVSYPVATSLHMEQDAIPGARAELVDAVRAAFGERVATDPVAGTANAIADAEASGEECQFQAYTILYKQLVAVSDGYYAPIAFRSSEEASEWHQARGASLRGHLSGLKGKLNPSRRRTLLGLPIPGRVPSSNAINTPGSMRRNAEEEPEPCLPCCAPCFPGRRRRRPAAHDDEPGARPAHTPRAELTGYDSSDAFELSTEAPAVTTSPGGRSPRRHAYVSKASPRQLLPVLVRVLLQSANPELAIPERGTGDIVDVKSQTVDPPVAAVAGDVSGNTRIPSRFLTGTAGAVLQEYAARYRISDVRLHAEVLGCYAQHLLGALLENSTRSSLSIVDFLLAVANSAKLLVVALKNLCPPRSDLMMASTVLSRLSEILSTGVRKHTSIFYQNHPEGGLDAMLQAMQHVWKASAFFKPSLSLPKDIVDCLAQSATMAYSEQLQAVSAVEDSLETPVLGDSAVPGLSVAGHDAPAPRVLSSVLVVLPVSACNAVELHSTVEGITVGRLGQAAFTAGLLVGDVVTSVNGRPALSLGLATMEHLLRKASSAVELAVMRLAKVEDIQTVKLIQASGTVVPVNSLELTIGRGQDLLGDTDDRLQALLGDRVYPRVVAYWVSTGLKSFASADGDPAVEAPTRIAPEAGSTTTLRGLSPDWMSEKIVVPFPEELNDQISNFHRRRLPETPPASKPKPASSPGMFSDDGSDGSVDGAEESKGPEPIAPSSPLRHGQVRFLMLRVEVHDDGDGSRVDGDVTSGTVLAYSNIPVNVWPLPTRHSAESLAWQDLKSVDGSKQSGKLEVGVGFTRRSPVVTHAESQLLSVKALLAMINAVRSETEEARDGPSSGVLASALGVPSGDVAVILAKGLYACLLKDVELFLANNPPSPHFVPAGVLEVYTALKALHASMSGLRFPPSFKLLPIDEVFEVHIPGWVVSKHLEVTHTYMPRIFSDDDLKPLSPKTGVLHSFSAQNVFWLARQLLEAFKNLPRSFDVSHVARFAQRLLCDPVSQFSKMQSQAVSSMLRSVKGGRSDLADFYGLGPTSADGRKAAMQLAVRLNNLYICRQNIYVVLNAVNKLDTVDVRLLELPGEVEGDSDASDDEAYGETKSEEFAAAGAGGSARDAWEHASSPVDVGFQDLEKGSAVVHTLQVYRVTVTVLSASSLPRMDLAGLAASDPYVTMSLGTADDHAANKCETATTFVKSKESDPVWNQTFVMLAFSPDVLLRLTTFDWDGDESTRDDLIGSTSVQLGSLLDAGAITFDAHLHKNAASDHVDSRLKDSVSGDDDAVAAFGSAEATRPAPDAAAHRKRGRLSYSVLLETVDVGGVADTIVADELNSTVLSVVQVMHVQLRPLLVSSLTPKKLPDVVDAAFTQTALKPVTKYLDAQLSFLHGMLYPHVMDKFLTRLWSGIVVEMYDLLLPNLPMDNAVTNLATGTRRRSRRYSTGILFWKKDRYRWLNSGQVALMRLAYLGLKQFFEGGGHGIPSTTAEDMAQPLPTLLEEWDAPTDVLAAEMGTLYSQAVAAVEETGTWRSPKTNMSYAHIKAVLEYRRDELGDSGAGMEVERTEKWPEYVPKKAAVVPTVDVEEEAS